MSQFNQKEAESYINKLIKQYGIKVVEKEILRVFNPRLKQWIGYWTGHP